MPRSTALSILICLAFIGHACADELLNRYEGDVHPADPSTGWLEFNPCERTCTEFVEQGHFGFFWPTPGDGAGYGHRIAVPGEATPSSLWVEWRYRSNHPLGEFFFSCDGSFTIQFRNISEKVNTYGDAVITASGDGFVPGLELNVFHTLRFESLDGTNFLFAVNGYIFAKGPDNNFDNGFSTIQFRGGGGCIDDYVDNMINEWDFVRYGTISFGEQIISSNPPQGFLDARKHVGLDHFTITYDSPNYAYLDEITVETTSAVTPQVIATRRLDNGEPDTVEIVLDQPIPLNATTRFTFNDGVTANTIEYTFAPADTDGDGNVTLSDFAAFQRCMGSTDPTGACLPLDLDNTGDVTLFDYRELQPLLHGP